jgi:hypothetical protein
VRPLNDEINQLYDRVEDYFFKQLVLFVILDVDDVVEEKVCGVWVVQHHLLEKMNDIFAQVPRADFGVLQISLVFDNFLKNNEKIN